MYQEAVGLAVRHLKSIVAICLFPVTTANLHSKGICADFRVNVMYTPLEYDMSVWSLSGGWETMFDWTELNFVADRMEWNEIEVAWSDDRPMMIY